MTKKSDLYNITLLPEAEPGVYEGPIFARNEDGSRGKSLCECLLSIHGNGEEMTYFISDDSLENYKQIRIALTIRGEDMFYYDEGCERMESKFNFSKQEMLEKLVEVFKIIQKGAYNE